MSRKSEVSVGKAQKVFRRRKILTLGEVAELIQSSIHTARRRLKEWQAHTSYNQNLSLRVTLSSVEGTLRRCFVWLFLFPSGYIQETILEANSEGTTGSRPCVLESYFD